MIKKRGQITIFVILAIIVVAIAVLIFTISNSTRTLDLSPNIEPVYNSFLLCLEENLVTGASILGSQAGYIEVPEFDPGSRYMPFSSQLDFVGSPVPYWYYISGNNLQKEQIPSEREMEEQLEEFLEKEMDNCLFDEFYEQGYYVDYLIPEASIDIQEEKINLILDMPLNIANYEESVLINEHEFSINSNLGKLYDSAKKIYEYEQETLFLEDYAIDTLRSYAPVDGYEISCSPLHWNADQVFNELEIAIEANTLALKSSSGDYVLNDLAEYFLVDLPVDEDVRFINSRNWASSLEVNPSEDVLLLSTPVGNQEGLGVLGFCYVPYHFVYNVRYPVLIQVYEGDEIFQFPVAVVLQNNNPRNIFESESLIVEEPQICPYKNTLMNVNTYDLNYGVVEADISYDCLGEVCDIGQSPLSSEFPQCVNGYLIAKAEGFKPARILTSTLENSTTNIILDKIYELPVKINLGGQDSQDKAIVSFVSSDFSSTIVYPDQSNIKLAEGDYNVSVYVYEDSSLFLEEGVQEQCYEIPSSGIGGLFGFTKTECVEIEMPEQTINSVLSGGGSSSQYIFEYYLKDASYIQIDVPKLKIPESLDELQNNYILFENSEASITLK